MSLNLLQKKLISSINKAATWLCSNDETHGFLSNHLAATASGLYNAFIIADKNKFHSRYLYFLKKLWITNLKRDGI